MMAAPKIVSDMCQRLGDSRPICKEEVEIFDIRIQNWFNEPGRRERLQRMWDLLNAPRSPEEQERHEKTMLIFNKLMELRNNA